MTFQQLDIIAPILAAIENEGYENPSPIQTEALPIILEGHDLLASAQTGTGKTAAFAIPIIQLINNNKQEGYENRKIKALVLSPTRELAEQIKESFKTYAGKLNIKTGAIYGGASQRGQEMMLKKGIDILVATPGRLIDLMQQRIVSLADVKYFVLDEADTLLDMGFIKDVKHIKGFITKERQTLMFSATVSPEVAKLAGELLVNPKTLIMAPPEMMIDKINHSLFYVEKKQKFDLLLDLLTDPKLESVLVFTRTKYGANKLVKDLVEYGVKVDAIHGNKSQSARQQALNDFKNKRTRVLIATDIASRGIDIDDLSHVINFDLPESPESYVHRIGRTGRRGLKGEAYTFCSAGERSLLKAVEKHTGLKLTVLDLKPVSEDSKFKRIVVADDQSKSRLDTTSRPERPSNRRYVGNEAPGKYKAKVEKKRDGKKQLVDNAPANFGKRINDNTDKKKLYQNISEGAFEDAETPKYRGKRPASVEVTATNETATSTEKREYSRPSTRATRAEGGYQGRTPRTEGGYQGRTPRTEGGYQGRTPRTTEGGEGERRSYSRPSTGGYEGRAPRAEGGYQGRTPRAEGGYQGRTPRTEGGYQGRTPRTEGGYQGRTPRAEGGYQGRTPRTEGGYQGRTPRTEGGYQGRTPRTEGGYQGRTPRTEGGYQGRTPRTTEGGEGERRSYSRPSTGGYEGRTPRTEGGYQGRAPRTENGYQGRNPRTTEGGERKSYSKSSWNKKDSPSNGGFNKSEGGERRSYGRPSTFKPKSSNTPFVEFGDGSAKKRPSTYQGRRNDFGGARPASGTERKPFNKGGYKGSSATARPRTGAARSYAGKSRTQRSD